MNENSLLKNDKNMTFSNDFFHLEEWFTFSSYYIHKNTQIGNAVCFVDCRLKRKISDYPIGTKIPRIRILENMYIIFDFTKSDVFDFTKSDVFDFTKSDVDDINLENHEYHINLENPECHWGNITYFIGTKIYDTLIGNEGMFDYREKNVVKDGWVYKKCFDMCENFKKPLRYNLRGDITIEWPEMIINTIFKNYKLSVCIFMDKK